VNESTTTSNDDVIPEDMPVMIRLSNKTGLTLRPLDRDDGDDDDYFGEGSTCLSVNRGEAHQRDETMAGKRERKTAVRDKRKVCRMQKKMMKVEVLRGIPEEGDTTTTSSIPWGGIRYSDSREDGGRGKWVTSAVASVVVSLRAPW
jgi:hypothetical protein